MEDNNHIKASSNHIRERIVRYEEQKIEREERIRKAFEPLAVDMLDYFKVNYAWLYKKLLRILTQEEAVAVIRDALMYSTSKLFESLGFDLLRPQADYCSFFYLHLNDFIDDYAFQSLSYYQIIRGKFHLFRTCRTFSIATSLKGAMASSFRKVAKPKHTRPIIESITWVDEKTGATYPIFETYIDEDGSLGIY